MTWLLAFAIGLLGVGHAAEVPVSVALPDPVSAYDVDYPESTVSVFGEWERLPGGGVTLPVGDYEGQFILTEESFHGSGLAGGWAAAMGAPAMFHLVAEQIPALPPSGSITVVALFLAFGLVGVRCQTA
jgi:hypothetical protein